jgi:hypothetical protein
MRPDGTTPIPGFPGYFVTRDGRVWSDHRAPGRWLAPKIGHGGYPLVQLYLGKTRRFVPTHRLVLLTFRGQPQPDQEARHLDGDPANNLLENLSWGTRLENAADKVRHGTMPLGERNGARTHPERLPRGERHRNAKLTDDDVRAIRTQRAMGVGVVELAARYGVTNALISHIARRRAWRHVP